MKNSALLASGIVVAVGVWLGVCVLIAGAFFLGRWLGLLILRVLMGF